MIDIKQVSHIYNDGSRRITALHDISLQIQRGEWVAITGANGSGKSTLIRMLNGLLVPSKGALSVAGYSLSEPPNRDTVKQIVQIVFQNPDAQTVGTTPLEDVAFGLENRGVPRDEMRVRIDRVLRQVGLQHKMNANVSTLSGGQRQRLAIACCLALEPECLVFDEAASMLDPQGRKQVYSIARSLWKSGISVIWVTQRLSELLSAPRVLVMEAGDIRYDGDARTLFYGTDLPQQLHWETPPVITIGRLLKERGLPFDQLPLSEEELGDLLCESNYQM